MHVVPRDGAARLPPGFGDLRNFDLRPYCDASGVCQTAGERVARLTGPQP
jgi:hypothetical protein